MSVTERISVSALYPDGMRACHASLQLHWEGMPTQVQLNMYAVIFLTSEVGVLIGAGLGG